ncbi:MAG: tRNA guanosine(34) transglycosylase Tgt, partial [Methanothrix sp.]|nr:tRNA guanosine(34) transglycosylase Tgt [Methanothrix sp.]
IETPYLVPVATLGSVRALGSDDLLSLGAQCTLANTYHLHLMPGDELIKRMGGLQRFMGLNRPTFTDSGGFQAFSLGFAREHNIGKIGNIFPDELASNGRCVNAMSSSGKGGDPTRIYQDFRKRYDDDCSGEKDGRGIVMRHDEDDNDSNDKITERRRAKQKPAKKENLTKITDDGISFKSLTDGAWHFLNAEKSMKIQSNLGSDIILAFDECTSPLSDYDYTKRAMQRSHVWAEQSIRYHDKEQALYGIIQGGWFEDLRRESTEAISAQPFDGIAIGGSLGNSKQDMHQVLDWTVPRLDEGRPRHLLGIGEIDDIFECVARGIDTFDCVSPTRIARRGSLLISPETGGSKDNKFHINIKSAKFKEDRLPIDPNCSCSTCRTYSRAYLHHLYVSRELSYFRLATLHNLHFMLRFMEDVRESIRSGTFASMKERWLRIA